MSSNLAMSDATEFLSGFFGVGNRLRWEEFASGSMSAVVRNRLSPWIEAFSGGTPPRLLPRVREDTQQTVWYAFADDPREARTVREQLVAFIGPTFSDFSGTLATLDPNDPVDAVCLRSNRRLVFKLRVVVSRDREDVSKRLDQLRTICSRVPERTVGIQLPIGRLLRDLEMSLLIGNAPNAERCYDALRGSGRLSAINLAFLRLRMLDAFGRSRDIISHPRLPDILRVPRPQQITQSIAGALYETELAEYEVRQDAEGCLSRFRELQERFGTLFRSVSGIRESRARKAFLVRAVAVDPPLLKSAEELVQTFEADTPERGWADSLLSHARQSGSTNEEAQFDATERARRALEQADFDAAFGFLIECEMSVAVLRHILECAVEIGTLEAARIALKMFHVARPEVREAVQSGRICRNHLTELASVGAADEGVAPPSDWFEWFKALDDEGFWQKAAEVARTGAQEWRLDDTPRAVASIAAELVRTRPSRPLAIVREALPTLINFFLPDGRPLRSLKPVYGALTDLIIYDDVIGEDDLAALEALVAAVLISAPSHTDRENDFEAATQTLRAIWDQVASPRNLDWIIGCIDLLIDVGTENHADVSGLFNAVVASVRAWPRRVREEQWECLELLASDLDQNDALFGLRPAREVERAAENIDNCLRGQSITIYSLTERIARRAGQLIEKRFRDVSIHYCHDKSNSDRLRSLARTSDIFIVNTWDAKHAATNAIHDIRARESITLRPESKSAAGMYRCLLDHARGQPVPA